MYANVYYGTDVIVKTENSRDRSSISWKTRETDDVTESLVRGASGVSLGV